MQNVSYKFVENFEGVDIFEMNYDSRKGINIMYSVGPQGVDNLLDQLDMTFGEAILLAKKHGAITRREFVNGEVSGPHMDFETIEGMKKMITVGKSARLLANICGEFTEEEMADKIERMKKGL